MALGSANGSFDQVNSRVITIRSDGISNVTPDALLDIQFRMIGRKVLHLDFRMPAQEVVHFNSLVPRRPIYIKINLPAFDAGAQVLQECQEASSISFGPTEQTMPTIERLYPPKEIESLVMLARSRHNRLRPTRRPDATELRMKREPAFVRKDQQCKFAELQDSLEFFFNPRRNSATPSSVACTYRYTGCLRANPSRFNQLRACRGLRSTLHTLCRNSTTTTPSHRVHCRPNSSGDFANALTSFCCAAGLMRVGRPGRCSSSTLSSPRWLALRIQSITACRLMPKIWLMAVDFHPFKSNRSAAILMPLQAPGTLSAFRSKAFWVMEGCVTFSGFMPEE